MNVNPKKLMKINEFITKICSSTDVLPRKQSAKSRLSEFNIPSLIQRKDSQKSKLELIKEND